MINPSGPWLGGVMKSAQRGGNAAAQPKLADFR
jgi:hypothetical protein